MKKLSKVFLTLSIVVAIFILSAAISQDCAMPFWGVVILLTKVLVILIGALVLGSYFIYKKKKL